MEVQHYKMKVRLLSFQNAYNFGAVLQAYGLQQTIRSLGYNDVRFINYNPKYLRDRYNPYRKDLFALEKNIKRTISKYINYPFFLVSTLLRNRKFRKSISAMLNQTNEVISGEQGLAHEEADVLICGSDQIWNTLLTNEFDPVFFGQGPYKYLGYAASYAPSTELSSLNEEKAQMLCNLLDGFKYLSVREKPVQEILQKHTEKHISLCVDPTILCGAASFLKICPTVKIDKDYILVYAYNPQDPIILEIIDSIPEVQKYDIHFILLGEKNVKTFFKRNYHSALTVPRFLSFFKSAKYVVTNSFHGLAFSLLFEKEFNVAYCPGKHIRCLSLLEQIGLSERLIYQGKMSKWDEIDYKIINKRLGSIRQESMCYLKKILEDET